MDSYTQNCTVIRPWTYGYFQKTYRPSGLCSRPGIWLQDDSLSATLDSLYGLLFWNSKLLSFFSPLHILTPVNSHRYAAPSQSANSHRYSLALCAVNSINTTVHFSSPFLRLYFYPIKLMDFVFQPGAGNTRFYPGYPWK